MSVVSETVPLTWQPDELLALALSRPSEALAAARQVLAQNPTAEQAAVAHQAAGVVLRHFGDIDDAIGELENARRFARRAGDLSAEGGGSSAQRRVRALLLNPHAAHRYTDATKNAS